MSRELSPWSGPRPSPGHDDIAAALPLGTVLPRLPLWPLAAGASRAHPLAFPRLPGPGADVSGLGSGAAALQAHMQEAAMPSADGTAELPARERTLRDYLWEIALKSWAGCGPRLFILVNDSACRELQPAAGTVRAFGADLEVECLRAAEVLLLVHAVRAAPATPLPAEAAWLTGAAARGVGVAEAAMPRALAACLAGAPVLDASYVDLAELRAAAGSPLLYLAGARALLADMRAEAMSGGAATSREFSLLQVWPPAPLAAIRTMLARHCEWRESGAWRGISGTAGGSAAASMPLTAWHRRRRARSGARGLANVLRPTFLLLTYPQLSEGLACGALVAQHRTDAATLKEFAEPGGARLRNALSTGAAVAPGALPHVFPPLIGEGIAVFGAIEAARHADVASSYLRPQAQMFALWEGWLWDTLRARGAPAAGVGAGGAGAGSGAAEARLALERRLVRYGRCGEYLRERRVGLFVHLAPLLRGAASAQAVSRAATFLGFHAAAAASPISHASLHRLAMFDLTHTPEVVPPLPPGCGAAAAEARRDALRVAAQLRLLGLDAPLTGAQPWDPLRPLHPHLVALAAQVRRSGALRAVVRALAATPADLADAGARAAAANLGIGLAAGLAYMTNAPALSALDAPRIARRIQFDVWLDEVVDFHEDAAAAIARSAVNLAINGSWSTYAYSDALPQPLMVLISQQAAVRKQSAMLVAAKAGADAAAAAAAAAATAPAGGGGGGAGGGSGGAAVDGAAVSRAEEVRRWLIADGCVPPELSPAAAAAAPAAAAPAMPRHATYITAAALADARLVSLGEAGAAEIMRQATILASGAATADYVDDRLCAACGTAAAAGADLLACSRCGTVYCGAVCQRVDWGAGHKRTCEQLAAGAAAAAAAGAATDEV